MTERVTPKYVRRHIATKDGSLFPTTDVQLIFDHLPAKGKNVDWKAAAHQLGEDLITSAAKQARQAETIATQQVLVEQILDGSELKLAAWLRASWLRFFIPRNFRGA